MQSYELFIYTGCIYVFVWHKRLTNKDHTGNDVGVQSLHLVFSGVKVSVCYFTV